MSRQPEARSTSKVTDMQPAIAFENGRSVLAYDPRDEGEETAVHDCAPPFSYDPRAERMEAIRGLVELLTSTAADATECGRHLAFIGHLLSTSRCCRTLRDLAAFTGLSVGAVNKILKRWRSTLGLA